MGNRNISPAKQTTRFTYTVPEADICIPEARLQICLIKLYDKTVSLKNSRREVISKLLWADVSFGTAIGLALFTCNFRELSFISAATAYNIAVTLAVISFILFCLCCLYLATTDSSPNRDRIISETITGIKGCCVIESQTESYDFQQQSFY